MSLCEPIIVWPAPGLPALLESGQPTFHAILAHRGRSCDRVRRWARGLTLIDTEDRSVVPLEVVDSRGVDRTQLESYARGFADLPEAREFDFTTCGLRLKSLPKPRSTVTSRVFDLVRQGRCERPRSVAVRTTAARRLSIAFACDIHYSSSWQPILAAVRRHAPDLASRVIDPMQMWQRFVDDANGLWRSGSLDLVILGGDLVDHVLTCNGDTDVESNVHRFLEALTPLRPPVIVIPGNHDFRLFPWRPRVYGLHAIGLDADETRRVLRSAGMWRGGPAGIRDLRSLQTRDAQGCTALARHLRLLAPATDFAVTSAGTRLVFASTGADAVTRWREIESARLPSLLRSLSGVWHFPDAEGLYDEQVDGIATALESSRGGAVFLHAPLLHPRNGQPVDGTLQRVSTDRRRSLGEELAVERRWHRAGLRSGICFRNSSRLLDRLLATPGPLVTFSGHVHRSGCIEVDRQTRRLRSAPLAAPADPSRSVLLVTSGALAHYRRDHQQSPGYLLAEFNDGLLANLRQRELVRPGR
jgi:hypothetical protein